MTDLNPSPSVPATTRPPRHRGLAGLLAASALVLASCGGVPERPGAPQPEPGYTEPAQGFVPAVGAPAETGAGVTRVRVSPTADEVAMMTYVNEFRTRGTVNGVKPEKSCWTTPLGPLSYAGVMSHAARQHAAYLTSAGRGPDAHAEAKTDHPSFWARTPNDRVARSAALYGEPTVGVGEVINYLMNASAADATTGLANSPAHCAILTVADVRYMGVGVASSGQSREYVAGNDIVWPHVYVLKISY